MRIPATLLAALLGALALNCAAQPFAVRLGTEKIALDAPPGFTDTTNLASPRLQDFAENVNSPSNRILLFGLTDADLRRFTLGDRLEVNRFVMIATPRALEQQRVTPDQFAAYATDTVGGLGKPAQISTDLVKYLESQPVGRSSLLEELRREPAAVSIMQAARLPPLPADTFWARPKPQYLVSTTTHMLVRSKVLQLSLFSLSETGADLEWMRGATLRWADELKRLNPR
jgi:putative ubiquitin-RnfH superfamily antitoxin RatB of RatAB toxin-antitoxin module